MNLEKAAYLIVRLALIAAGLAWIFATLTSHLLMPALLYDHGSSPPPLSERLPGIAVSVAAGLLLCVPQRWTNGRYFFWPRFAADLVLGSFLVRQGIHGLRDGVAGDKSWHVIPLSIIAIALAMVLPLSLLWGRRLGRKPETLAIAPSQTPPPMSCLES